MIEKKREASMLGQDFVDWRWVAGAFATVIGFFTARLVWRQDGHSKRIRALEVTAPEKGDIPNLKRDSAVHEALIRQIADQVKDLHEKLCKPDS